MLNSPFYQLQGLLGEDVMLLDATINESFQSHQELIPIISDYLISAGGKRVRPFLALGIGKLFNSSDPRRFYQAASLEFLHTATLLHDDIVDHSEQRRGQKSAHLLWGNEACVLVGDFLFAQAFRMMVKLADQRVLDILADTACKIAEGEVMQLSHAHDLELSHEGYIQMISGKTSILFQAATQTAALIAGEEEETAQHCAKYGLNLGIAFQLTDDALDYDSHQAELGKNIGDDFNEGKISAPALYSYRQGNAEIKAFWQQMLGENSAEKDFDKAKKIIEEQDIIAQVLEESKRFAQKAITALEPLPDAPIKQTLADCALYAATRRY